MSSAARRSQVSLGKVQLGKMGPHTLIQVTGVDGVLQNTIALLLPFGYSANPAEGSDVALLQVLGTADHVVALGGGLAGSAVADLGPGECGLAMNGQVILLRTGGVIEIIGGATLNLTVPAVNINASSAVNITTPVLNLTGTLKVNGTVVTVP